MRHQDIGFRQGSQGSPPIGITDVRGGFEKDDIVRIIDHTGNAVGVGKANCNSEQAREAMGKHGKKPVVHYDYLYIE